MPVYEYYCADCHTIYSFRAASFSPDKQPTCPKCGRTNLEKQISNFAIAKVRDEARAPDLANVDEAALERAMLALEDEAAGFDEENPQAMAKFMRKLYDSTGLQLGAGMEEAIRRMEAGEDPDKIEEEMGDTLEADESLFAERAGRKLDLKAVKKKFLPPSIDKTLYDL